MAKSWNLYHQQISMLKFMFINKNLAISLLIGWRPGKKKPGSKSLKIFNDQHRIQHQFVFGIQVLEILTLSARCDDMIANIKDWACKTSITRCIRLSAQTADKIYCVSFYLRRQYRNELFGERYLRYLSTVHKLHIWILACDGISKDLQYEIQNWLSACHALIVSWTEYRLAEIS